MVPSRPGCAPPPPAARSSSRPTASCRATSSCTRTCCVTDLLRLVRVNNLLLAAAGVLAGGWIALGAVRTPNVLALAAVAAVGVAMAGNVLNDIWDQAADRVNRSGGERPLATGPVDAVGGLVPDVVEHVARHRDPDRGHGRESQDVGCPHRAESDPASGENAGRGEQQV